MTTENGVPRVKRMRRHIETVRKRRDFVARRFEERLEAGTTFPEGDWDEAECAALSWAIDLMEAAWDEEARLNRRHDPGRGPERVAS